MAANIKNVLAIVNDKFANIQDPPSIPTDDDQKMAENIISILEGYALGEVIVENEALEFDESKYILCFFIFLT